MFDDINLAAKKDGRTPRKQQIDRLKFASFVSLFAVAAISLILFLINFRYSTVPIKKQQEAARQNLSPYNDTIAKIYLLNSRLSDISTVMSARRDLTQDVSQIINASDSLATVRAFSLDSQKNLTLTLDSNSLSNLDEFLNKVLKLSDSGVIGDVSLTSLQSSSGSYTLGLTIGLL